MKNKGYTLVELLICIVVIGLVLIVLPAAVWWTDRSIDFWLSYIAHAPRNCPMWLSAIATIIFNGIALAFNIVTEIFRHCA